MVRQISGSTSKTSSAPADSSDLGHWLTRELRVKGTPLPSLSEPPGDERAALAGWLTRDLTPKHSAQALALPVAHAGVAPPLRLEPFLSEVPLGALPPASEPLAPPVPPPSKPARRDSAASRPSPERPGTMTALRQAPLPSHASLPSESPPPRIAPSPLEELSTSVALATSHAPSALAPLGLEEDDLAVLPGRRRATGAERAKVALALLLGLLLVGVGLVTWLGQGPERVGEAAASNAAPRDNGVLLPPPPASDVQFPAHEAELARAARRGNAEPVEPEGSRDPRDPRFARGGPNVRRYADVPSPTLSRLAREQRRLANERDEAARDAKAAKP
jgi:hypothetical protein